MSLKVAVVFVVSAVVALCGSWLTFGGDPERTGKAAAETQLTRASIPHLKLLWSAKLENEPRELTALTTPVVLASQFTAKGVMDMVIVGGSADRIFALDGDTGKVLWSRQFRTEQKPRQEPDWLCPNGLNDTPVIDPSTKTVYVIAADGTLHALQAINGEELRTAQQFVPPFSKNWSLNLVNGILYTPVSQGCNAAKSGIATMDVRQQDVPAHFFESAPSGAGVWGRGGVAVDSATGVAYGATGDGPWDPAKGKYSDSVIAVNATGKLVDYFTPSNFEWITRKDLDMGNITPVLFPFEARKLLVTGGKEGVLYVLDTSSLGGTDHRTPLSRTPQMLNDEAQNQGRGFWGGLATDVDDSGKRFVYAPAWGPVTASATRFPKTHGEAPNGSIMAFTVVDAAGKPTLTPAWISRDLSVPEPPVVVNGIVFTLATGENVMQIDTNGNLLTTAQRATTKGHAMLEAFDARTGNELFSSGDTIQGWAHFTGLAVSNGHVYAVTHDSTVYAFGPSQ